MAATWPSIMPLGATTSAPAAAWASGDAPVELEGRVVEHLTVGAEHAAVAVVGVLVEAEVGHEHQLVPTASRTARRATCTMPSGFQASLPGGVLVRRHAEEDEPGHPERDQSLGLDDQ